MPNKTVRTLTPYIAETREYSDLSTAQKEQLACVEPSCWGDWKLYPCQVTLKSGRKVDRVYVVNAQDYLDNWGGVWPDIDPANEGLDITVDIDSVVRIEASSNRLPPRIANQLYGAGESGMGYTAFTLIFRNGDSMSYLIGNAIDFLLYPPGVSAKDVVDVVLHEGGEHPSAGKEARFAWCFFGKGVPKWGT